MDKIQRIWISGAGCIYVLFTLPNGRDEIFCSCRDSQFRRDLPNLRLDTHD